MKYRAIGNTGIQASVLGLGCMRLPLENIQGSTKVDEAEAVKLIRYAIDHGVNYIDTAYPYHDGESERIVGKALKEGYRERIHLVTKSPSWLIESHEDFNKYLDEQLEKLGTDHLDIYLLHALSKQRWDKYMSVDLFKAIETAKAQGKIKHIGFSFHDEYPVFEEIINAYPWDVCMLQLNFMDMDEQAGLKGLKLAESLGVPVIVMEPLKGGMLTNPAEDVLEVWQSYPEKRSAVEWAMRYIANFENVKVVLSGMSNLEQLKENIEIADRLLPNNLDQEGLALVDRVKQMYISKVQVPCTQCRYCVPCPHGVEIPRTFTFLNRGHIYNTLEAMKDQYLTQIKPEGRASACVACGECEPKCPQKIEIIQKLKVVAGTFEASL